MLHIDVTGCNSVSVVNKMYQLNFMYVMNHEWQHEKYVKYL